MERRGKTGAFDDLIGRAFQYAVPLACLLRARVSDLRRHRLKTSAGNMAAAASANELQIEALGSGQRGAADALQMDRPVDESVGTTEITAPVCPQCLGPMVRRVAMKGASAGEAFWGCAVFPKCRGTM
jgi:restriction system protein